MFENIYSQIMRISEFNIVKAEMYRIANCYIQDSSLGYYKEVGRESDAVRGGHGGSISALYFSYFCTSELLTWFGTCESPKQKLSHPTGTPVDSSSDGALLGEPR